MLKSHNSITYMLVLCFFCTKHTPAQWKWQVCILDSLCLTLRTSVHHSIHLLRAWFQEYEFSCFGISFKISDAHSNCHYLEFYQIVWLKIKFCLIFSCGKQLSNHLCPSVCLLVHLSVPLSLSLCRSVPLSIHPSICLSLSVCLSVRPSIHQSVCPSVHLSVCTSVCLSVLHQSACLSVSVHPSVHAFVSPSLHPSVGRSIDPSVWQKKNLCICYGKRCINLMPLSSPFEKLLMLTLHLWNMIVQALSIKRYLRAKNIWEEI